MVAAGASDSVVRDNSGAVAAGSLTIAQILSGVAGQGTDALHGLALRAVRRSGG